MADTDERESKREPPADGGQQQEASTSKRDQQQDQEGGESTQGNAEQADKQREVDAVSLLQKRYRGYRSRREQAGLNLAIPQGRNQANNKDKGKGRDCEDEHKDSPHQEASPISPNTRWNEAITSGGHANASEGQNTGKNDARSRWHRSAFYAERITGTDGRQVKGRQEEGDGEGESTAAKAAALAPNKQMEAQYWLELVDSKHRYGTNLKSYHEAWNKSDTKHNFFYWLDHGSGASLDLSDCPRDQLDRERVTYLSAAQRKNYLVDVGKDGLLYWHRNGRKVDTAKGKWEDLGHGRGVGYKGEKDNLPPPADPADEVSSSASSSSNSSMYSSSDSEAEGDHFKGEHYKNTRESGESRHSYITSPKMVMDLLLRKTINSNTWIYVCDTSGRLFVGIKSTGGFQHSSFMYGATVASAGLLKAQSGRLTSLSPLSGHYRAGTVHFKAFHKSLEERGVDMSKVSVSKSLFIIRGIEKYGKFSKKKKSLKSRMRKKLHLGPTDEEKQQAKEEKRDKEIERDAVAKHSTDEEEGKPSERSKKADTKSRDGSPSREQGDGSDSGDDEDDTTGGVEPNMHDDIKKEDMTDQQRAERAVALIRSAFSKGLKGEQKKIEEAGPAEDHPDAET